MSVRSGPAQGIQLRIDPRREKFLWTGLHETGVQAAVQGLLRPGLTFWDVGAHVGLFTLLAARIVGERGSVHAFEPMEENRRRLEEAIVRNGFGNVTVHALALASKPGDALLHGHESSAMWSLAGEDAAGVTVRCETLDSLRLPPPDVVKVDAERVELDVLRGGSRLLASRSPSVLVELMTDDDVKDARELLPQYTFENIDERHWLLSRRTAR